MKKLLIIFISTICFAFTCKKAIVDSYIQKGIKIDSIKIADKKRRFEIFLTIPVSKIKKLDLLIKKEILEDKAAFINMVNENIKENNGKISFIGSDYSCVLNHIFDNKFIISYNFINSQYIGGTAHGISRFKSYNYDLKKGKFINFNDYFHLKSDADSTYLLSAITKRINRKGVEVNTLERIKFNILKDSISFNFDNYEIASYSEGLIQAKISKNEIGRLINSNYR
ncbi:MAG: hypothetical protein CFE24_08170 [Flavobacterium sp. BFFFF2]|nr:MAG: hypothetical protein CFE24_08170 [Flavobacterium sp. BFFFF2]